MSIGSYQILSSRSYQDRSWVRVLQYPVRTLFRSHVEFLPGKTPRKRMLKVIPFNCIAHPLCASIFAWLACTRVGAHSKLGRFSMKTELLREMNCIFSKTNSVTPLFYSNYLKKTWLCMIYPNFKNFSLFNFQIFWLIHYYNPILGISLEACMCSLGLLFHYFYF